MTLIQTLILGTKIWHNRAKYVKENDKTKVRDQIQNPTVCEFPSNK